MKQQINEDYLVRWCVCIRTSKKGPWGIYHTGDSTNVPLIFATKGEASEKARSLSREQEPHRRWRYMAGRFFYSGEVSVKPPRAKMEARDG